MTRVAIVHDYLTQRGGAERVALEMTRAFPGATLYTTVFNPSLPPANCRTTRIGWSLPVGACRDDADSAAAFNVEKVRSMKSGTVQLSAAPRTDVRRNRRRVRTSG